MAKKLVQLILTVITYNQITGCEEQISATECFICNEFYFKYNGICIHNHDYVSHCNVYTKKVCSQCQDDFVLENNQCFQFVHDCDSYDALSGTCNECYKYFYLHKGKCHSNYEFYLFYSTTYIFYALYLLISIFYRYTVWFPHLDTIYFKSELNELYLIDYTIFYYSVQNSIKDKDIVAIITPLDPYLSVYSIIFVIIISAIPIVHFLLPSFYIYLTYRAFEISETYYEDNKAAYMQSVYKYLNNIHYDYNLQIQRICTRTSLKNKTINVDFLTFGQNKINTREILHYKYRNAFTAYVHYTPNLYNNYEISKFIESAFIEKRNKITMQKNKIKLIHISDKENDSTFTIEYKSQELCLQCYIIICPLMNADDTHISLENDLFQPYSYDYSKVINKIIQNKINNNENLNEIKYNNTDRIDTTCDSTDDSYVSMEYPDEQQNEHTKIMHDYIHSNHFNNFEDYTYSVVYKNEHYLISKFIDNIMPENLYYSIDVVVNGRFNLEFLHVNLPYDVQNISIAEGEYNVVCIDMEGMDVFYIEHNGLKVISFLLRQFEDVVGVKLFLDHYFKYDEVFLILRDEIDCRYNYELIEGQSLDESNLSLIRIKTPRKVEDKEEFMSESIDSDFSYNEYIMNRNEIVNNKLDMVSNHMGELIEQEKLVQNNNNIIQINKIKTHVESEVNENIDQNSSLSQSIIDLNEHEEMDKERTDYDAEYINQVSIDIGGHFEEEKKSKVKSFIRNKLMTLLDITKNNDDTLNKELEHDSLNIAETTQTTDPVQQQNMIDQISCDLTHHLDMV